MTKAFKIKMYICFNPAHTCVTWHMYKNILCNIAYNSRRLETRWTIISRYSCIMQPFKNEAVLYKPSRTISKIHSKVGKRCKTTQNTNSLGKIDVFSICVYKFIYIWCIQETKNYWLPLKKKTACLNDGELELFFTL